MKAKNMILQLIRAVGRGLQRWLELLGENPPIGRECGLDAWRHLQRLPHTRVTDEVRPAREETSKPRLFLKLIH